MIHSLRLSPTCFACCCVMLCLPEVLRDEPYLTETEYVVVVGQSGGFQILFFNGCNYLIYSHKKDQVFSEKTYGKLWKDIRLKAKSFPIVSGKTMGKLFERF